MTALGIFLKKLRLDHGEVLINMAQKLGVSSAYLSTVENGKRSAPVSWVEAIAREYSLSEEQTAELSALVSESISQVRLNVGSYNSQKRDLAVAFARSFDSFDDDDVRTFMEYIQHKGGK